QLDPRLMAPLSTIVTTLRNALQTVAWPRFIEPSTAVLIAKSRSKYYNRVWLKIPQLSQNLLPKPKTPPKSITQTSLMFITKAWGRLATATWHFLQWSLLKDIRCEMSCVPRSEERRVGKVDDG